MCCARSGSPGRSTDSAKSPGSALMCGVAIVDILLVAPLHVAAVIPQANGLDCTNDNRPRSAQSNNGESDQPETKEGEQTAALPSPVCAVDHEPKNAPTASEMVPITADAVPAM